MRALPCAASSRTGRAWFDGCGVALSRDLSAKAQADHLEHAVSGLAVERHREVARRERRVDLEVDAVPPLQLGADRTDWRFAEHEPSVRPGRIRLCGAAA